MWYIAKIYEERCCQKMHRKNIFWKSETFITHIWKVLLNNVGNLDVQENRAYFKFINNNSTLGGWSLQIENGSGYFLYLFSLYCIFLLHVIILKYVKIYLPSFWNEKYATIYIKISFMCNFAHHWHFYCRYLKISA